MIPFPSDHWQSMVYSDATSNMSNWGDALMWGIPSDNHNCGSGQTLTDKRHLCNSTKFQVNRFVCNALYIQCKYNVLQICT
jgi:hypothetical protein